MNRDELKKISKSLSNSQFAEYITAYCQKHGTDGSYVFSSPGRIELCGNHTDHQHGKVLSAAVTNDIVAIAKPRYDNIIKITSHGYKQFAVHLDSFDVVKREMRKSSGIVRGIAASLQINGITTTGMDITTASTVPRGFGLSSSAAFENLITRIVEFFSSNRKLTATECAEVGCYSENVYFGKPCGLMDQLTSANGGCIMTDFNQSPVCPESVKADSVTDNFSISVIKCGHGHKNLTRDYAAIVSEMKEISAYFGKELLIDVSEDEFYLSLPQLIRCTSDRAITRAMHFFDENRRTEQAYNALECGNSEAFLTAIRESGDSSFKYLQNIYSDRLSDRELAIVIGLCERFIKNSGIKGACRVHGGGFGGTVLVIIEKAAENEFIRYIEGIIGAGSVETVEIRECGSCVLGETSEIIKLL